MHIPAIPSVFAALLGFCGVLLWRLREGRRPVTRKTILIPPLGMATGFCMFFVPSFRVPLAWAVAAFLVGAVMLAYPLIRTSRLVLDGETVMIHRSKIFFAVILILALIRFLAHNYVGKFISIPQTGALFFVLAFGMILTWRISMYLEYNRLLRIPNPSSTSLPIP